MTRERLLALSEHRAHLVERAAAEREALAALLAHTDAAAQWLSLGGAAIASLRRRPLWVAGGIMLLFALRPTRTLRWLASAWSLWRIYRTARAGWRRIASI